MEKAKEPNANIGFDTTKYYKSYSTNSEQYIYGSMCACWKYYPGTLDLTFIRVIFDPTCSWFPFKVIHDPDKR